MLALTSDDMFKNRRDESAIQYIVFVCGCVYLVLIDLNIPASGCCHSSCAENAASNLYCF